MPFSITVPVTECVTAAVNAYLIDNAPEIHEEWLHGVKNVGVTAGASTPDNLVGTTVRKLAELAGGPASSSQQL